MESNIEVAARIRPPIHTNHLVEDVCLYGDPYTKEIVLANQMSFYVDYALPIEINQSQLFDSIILPRIDYMLQGYNVSFIAYGHVNSGKTYTILGPGLHCALSETTYGILPRSGREIFNKLLAFRQQFGLQFKVLVSFIEICNEEAKDLLASHNLQCGNNIGFKTNDKGLTVLCGIEEFECHNVSELFNCLRVGMSSRRTVRTNLNSTSSLSHCVVIIKVEQRWLSNQGQLEVITSQAMFVDLAGSEQMFLMSPIDSNQVHQTTVGNMGLGVISAIIASFSGQWLPSSPFTQSLLFPLLKDSFIGSIKTLLICCLSPSSSDYSETLNSLRLIDHIHTLNKYSFIRETGRFNTNYNNENQLIIDNSEIDSNKGREVVVNSNGENRHNGDSFGLEFAASQWLKLVSNAEGLFNKLANNDIPEEAREQIEEWLCLKQECEECFGVDSGNCNNNRNHFRRSLERIEEVTETDTKSKSGQSSNNCSDSEAMNSITESAEEDGGEEEEIIKKQNDENGNEGKEEVEDDDDEDDDDNYDKNLSEQELYYNTSHGDDFIEKLDQLMCKFKTVTDKAVDTILSKTLPRVSDEKEKKVIHKKRNNWSSGRRKSILPGENQICLSSLSLNQEVRETSVIGNSEVQLDKENEFIDKSIVGDKSPEENCNIILPGLEDINDNNCLKSRKLSLEPEKEFRLLNANSDIKQSQIGLANLDLEAASKRIDELQSMIKIKEQFIEEMIKNSGARISAKAKFQRKHTRLEEEYFKARTQLAKAEKALNHEEGNATLESEVQKYKILASQYEKRLQDIEMIKQIAGDSAKKVLELENSLHNSKRKMQKLKKQLKKEEEHKYSLEQELIEDQKRIKLLEEKYKIQSDKLKGITNDDENGNEEKRLKWIAEEEERLINLQLSSQKLQEQLQEKQNILEKRESFLKEKLSQEKSMSKSLLHVSARISHLEQVLKEKSTNLEQADDLDTKEALRHEIRNLRKTRDCLVEQRRNLDAKFNKDKVLTTVEERKFLECDEAIEAIDATIEYKNELMCGRKGLVGEENGEREKGEEMLLARLMKLSTMEMRILLYKYFQKVIDLRESGRKMEMQIAELDRQAETQAWKIQALSNALQQAHLESERRLIAAQKEHQEKLHLIFRHFADETSGHSSGADDTEKCRRQNKALKQRVLELEAMLYKARNSQHTRGGASTSSAQPSQPTVTATQLPQIPQRNLKQLQGGASSSHTTKVTRQKNKLIIQQQKTNEKPSK